MGKGNAVAVGKGNQISERKETKIMWETVIKFYDIDSDLACLGDDYVDALNNANPWIKADNVESITIYKNGSYYESIK